MRWLPVMEQHYDIIARELPEVYMRHGFPAVRRARARAAKAWLVAQTVLRRKSRIIFEEIGSRPAHANDMPPDFEGKAVTRPASIISIDSEVSNADINYNSFAFHSSLICSINLFFMLFLPDGTMNIVRRLREALCFVKSYTRFITMGD